jgi:hypothetical protein
MRTTILIACCLALTLPAAADSFTLGAGYELGSGGVSETAYVGTFDLAHVDTWSLGPVRVPAADLAAIVSTPDFNRAYIGAGIKRGIAILSAGYDTETRWGVRLSTVIGVGF